MHIEIKLYATLKNFAPETSAQYPIEEGMTVEDLLQKLSVPANQAKLIFLDGVRGKLTSKLTGVQRVGIFPPVGGG